MAIKKWQQTWNPRGFWKWELQKDYLILCTNTGNNFTSWGWLKSRSPRSGRVSSVVPSSRARTSCLKVPFMFFNKSRCLLVLGLLHLLVLLPMDMRPLYGHMACFLVSLSLRLKYQPFGQSRGNPVQSVIVLLACFNFLHNTYCHLTYYIYIVIPTIYTYTTCCME